ncbi:MAG: type II toxin-antitoxin system Phd/YefM family antitoxin [Gammaproteobacteria bacterium]|nr:type II toxin-antitoxin system Phd/YefM family antitoxin [Gammaproteobacteria bacterium]
MIISQTTAMNVRKNFGDILNTVQYQHNPIVITKGGKKVAAVVDIELFERIHAMREEFERLSKELQTGFQHLKSEEVESLVNEAVKKVRA